MAGTFKVGKFPITIDKNWIWKIGKNKGIDSPRKDCFSSDFVGLVVLG